MTTLRRSLAAFAVLVAVAAINFLLTPPAFAEKRVALVIGNSAYQHSSRLPNPRNHAEDVAAALRRIGFETILGLDSTGQRWKTPRSASTAQRAEPTWPFSITVATPCSTAASTI